MIWFYGISTIVGYLMPNPLYTYKLNIYDLIWFYGISAMVGLSDITRTCFVEHDRTLSL